ncbi:MAG TPA: hypothetical protein VGA56_00260 [Opitutaceae bacterium]
MKHLQLAICAGLLVAGNSFSPVAAFAAGASGGIVLPAVKRMEALKAAERTFKQAEFASKAPAADLPDPFFRVMEPEPIAVPAHVLAEPVRPAKSGEQILEGVAPRISPTGTMLLGTEQYLLIGGRRYRVGDQISVTFEEMVYAVEIASIERNSYTLRLNETELRRDFK